MITISFLKDIKNRHAKHIDSSTDCSLTLLRLYSHSQWWSCIYMCLKAQRHSFTQLSHIQALRETPGSLSCSETLRHVTHVSEIEQLGCWFVDKLLYLRRLCKFRVPVIMHQFPVVRVCDWSIFWFRGIVSALMRQKQKKKKSFERYQGCHGVCFTPGAIVKVSTKWCKGSTVLKELVVLCTVRFLKGLSGEKGRKGAFVTAIARQTMSINSLNIARNWLRLNKQQVSRTNWILLPKRRDARARGGFVIAAGIVCKWKHTEVAVLIGC